MSNFLPFFSNPQISPQLAAALAQLALASGGTSATAAAGAGTTPQLQAFLDAIPVANDGDVITPDHHNTLRTAIAQVARALDETQFARVVTQSYTPALLPVAGGGPAWRTAEGYAVGPASGNQAEGWLPLELANGTSIDALTLRGKRPGAVSIWVAALRRAELAGGSPIDVCTKEIQATTTSADGSFTVTIAPETAGLTATQAAERRLVDTTRYRYWFYTQFAGAAQASALEIRLVQVTTTRD
jgi:hypothetical protein